MSRLSVFSGFITRILPCYSGLQATLAILLFDIRKASAVVAAKSAPVMVIPMHARSLIAVGTVFLQRSRKSDTSGALSKAAEMNTTGHACQAP
ncbi:hypothetical protein CVO74_08760 [Xanthomonas prunicola]|uniref:Uncharacterized protein n=1 Tax=Xanthomonas prunicola TaxID=2053930 RepID=A0A2N3RKF2_9XANT|nr:hypothetical protein XpruCFBP8353_06710 [Xanthomonas prunicola]PKV17246.1 hypothetical protein XpruCFBP8354_06710 [Xanthomonas prunicola]PKV21138.1 hypothetical protein CVO74_08760 [Xanthomonas prunicola]